MASGMHQVKLNLPVEHVWNFVKNMDNWAPLVPGYTEHVMKNDQESVWRIHGDLGVVEKTVSLKVTITEWIEPTNVRFQVSGLNGNCTGEGYFKASSLSENETEMTGYLNMKIKGMMGTVVNPILKTLLPKAGRQFTETVAAEMLRARLVAK